METISWYEYINNPLLEGRDNPYPSRSRSTRDVEEGKSLQWALGIEYLLEKIPQKCKFVDDPGVGCHRNDQERIGTTVDVVSETDTPVGIDRNRRKGPKKPVQIVVKEKLANDMIFPVHPFQFDGLNVSVASSNETDDHNLVLFGHLDDPVMLTPDNERMGRVKLNRIRKLVG
jgi:hypothetical protein